MPVVSNRVVARSSIGRFIRECEMAAHDTVEKAVERGAEMSRTLAPVGHKHDLRSIPIRDSIRSKMLGRTAGHWIATARHAGAQEFGARPHTIMGSPYLRFFWEEKGRMWIPGLFGERDIINHPGNAPQPYMRPAYEFISRDIMRIARGEYPG